MSTIIRCTCGKKVRIQERYFGHRVRCPACGAIHVEQPRQAEPVPRAEPVPLAMPVARAPAVPLAAPLPPPLAEPVASAPTEWDIPEVESPAHHAAAASAEDDIDIEEILAEDEAPTPAQEQVALAEDEIDIEEILAEDEAEVVAWDEPVEEAAAAEDFAGLIDEDQPPTETKPADAEDPEEVIEVLEETWEELPPPPAPRMWKQPVEEDRTELLGPEDLAGWKQPTPPAKPRPGAKKKSRPDDDD